jgi:hypothetical protein
MASDQYPTGYVHARAVFEHALLMHMSIRAASTDLGRPQNDTVDTVHRVRQAYLDGRIEQGDYESFMVLRNRANVAPISRPKPAAQPAAQAPKDAAAIDEEIPSEVSADSAGETSEQQVTQMEDIVGNTWWSSITTTPLHEDEPEPKAEPKSKAKAKPEFKAKPKAKGRTQRAASEDIADEDVSYDESLNYTELERDETGQIVAYRFCIQLRDGRTLEGVFSRSEMERIYAMYSYVTVNQLTADFPAYNSAEMRRILRAFNITKDRKIPPHVVEETNPDEAAAFALNAKERVAYKKLDLNRAGFVEKQLRKTQGQLDELQRERHQINDLLVSILDDYIEEGYLGPAAPVMAYRPKYGEEIDGRQPAMLFYGDTHFGKKFSTEDMCGQGRGTSVEILTERLICAAEKAVEQMKRLKTHIIHVFNMGDIFESLLLDGMHPQHVAQMDVLGELQLKAAVKAHVDMLSYIIEHGTGENGELVQIIFHGLGGNHDRMGKTREEDKRRTGALMFYAMLEMVLGYKLPHQVLMHTYPKGIFCVRVGRLNVIGFHGDSNLSRVKTPDLLNTFRHRDMNNYTVVASAHLHNNFTDEGHNYVRLTIGAICSADDYSQNELSKGSQPSVTLIEPAPGYGADLLKKTLY